MDKLEKIRREIERAQKHELLRRILKYSCMCLGVVTILAVCLTYLTGNRFDFQNTNIKPTALLEAYSTPQNADVHIYGDQNFYKTIRTNNEAVLDVGRYAVKFSLNGYRDWFKEISLDQGQVLWLNYAVMIAEDVQTSDVANITGPISSALKTRDNKWILLHLNNPDQPAFNLLAVEDPTNIKITPVTIPDGILSVSDPDTPSNLQIIESDTGSRYFLLRHDYTAGGVAKSEFIYFDRRDLKTFHNISRDFAVDIKSIAFNQRGENQFYAIDSSDNLRKIDYNNRSVSAPLVEHAVKFEQYDDKVTAITLNSEGQKTIGVLYNNKYYAIQTYPAGDDLLTDAYFTNYYNLDYVVILHGDTVEIVRRPLERAVAYLPSYQVDFTPKWISLNASGRFILVGADEHIDSYDQELSQHKKFSISGLTQKPTWLDDFYLFANVNDQNKIFEFDGDNLNTLSAGAASRFALFDPNKRYLFSLNLDANGAQILQRSKLTAN
jgi:hypothetical protein